MTQILFSRKDALGNTRRTNAAFKKIFGNVTSNERKAEKLFKAFKSQTNDGAVTKDIMRKTFAEARRQGMSQEDMRVISGKVLKGESAGSRLRYLNDPVSVGKSSASAVEQKPRVDMREVMRGIMAKRKTANNSVISSFNKAGTLTESINRVAASNPVKTSAQTGPQLMQKLVNNNKLKNVGVADSGVIKPIH